MNIAIHNNNINEIEQPLYNINHKLKEFLSIIETTFHKDNEIIIKDDNKFFVYLKILAIESNVNCSKFDEESFCLYEEVVKKMFECNNESWDECVWNEVIRFVFNVIHKKNVEKCLIEKVISFQKEIIVMLINKVKIYERYSGGLVEMFLSNVHEFVMEFCYYKLIQNESVFKFLLDCHNELCLKENTCEKEENILRIILELLKSCFCLKEDNENFDDNDLIENDLNQNENNTKSFIISSYIRQGGVEALLSILQVKCDQFNIIKNITVIIHELATTSFKESAIIFLNYSYLKTFVIKFKTVVIYSTHKINDSLYLELMLYMKNIMKNCKLTTLCEETNLIEYILTEINDIYKTVRSLSYKTMKLLYDILHYIAQHDLLITPLISHSKFKQLLTNTLLLFKNKEEIKNNHTFQTFISILIEAFKHKNSSYELYTQKQQLIQFNHILSRNINTLYDVFKVIEYYQILIKYEQSVLNKEERVINLQYINYIYNHLNRDNNDLIKDSLDKCLLLLIGPQSKEIINRVSKENNKLLYELSLVSNNKNKYARRRVVTKKNCLSAKNVLNKEHNTLLFLNRTMLQFNFTLDLINENIKGDCHNNNQNGTQLNNLYEELGKLIKVLFHLAKNTDVFNNLYDSNAILKLLYILNDTTSGIPFQIYTETFSFIMKLTTLDIFMNRLLEDAKMCDYFLKEFSEFINGNNANFTEYDICKMNAITKIISELFINSSFFYNNQSLLSEEKIISVMTLLIQLKNENHSDIFINLLKLLNIIINNSSCECNFSKIGNVLMQIWNIFVNVKLVIIEIINVICNCYNHNSLISALIEHKFTNKMKSFLEKDTIDGDTIFNCLNCIELLMSTSDFLAVNMQEKLLSPIICSSNKQLFNERIIQKFLVFIIKVIHNNKVSFVSSREYINDLCLKILEKYSKTSNSKIIMMDIELIIYLIMDSNNFIFYSRKESFNSLIQSFKNSDKIKEVSIISLKLIRELSLQLGTKVKDIMNEKQNVNKEQMLNEIYLITNEYNYEKLFEYLEEIFNLYNEQYEIVLEINSILVNMFSFSLHEKQNICKLLFKFGTLSLSNIKHFIQNIRKLIQIDYNNNIAFLELFSFLNEIVKLPEIQKQVLNEILQLLYSFTNKYIHIKSIPWENAINILSHLEPNLEISNDIETLTICNILFTLVQHHSLHSQIIPFQFIVKLLRYISNKNKEFIISINDNDNFNIIKAIKDILPFTNAESKLNESEIKENSLQYIKDDLYLLFIIYKSNEKELIHILDIILFFTGISNEIKTYLITQTDLLKELQLLSSTSKFENPLIEYQIKGCILNLETPSSYIPPIKEKQSQHLFPNDEHEIYEFLSQPKNVKVYTDDGQVRKVNVKFIWKNNTNKAFEKLIAVEIDKLCVVQEMNIYEMESCIRSASAYAFQKSKGFFKKKPKARNCFSIFGEKRINKKQRTLNIECGDENTCIKYVDYISRIIFIEKQKAEN